MTLRIVDGVNLRREFLLPLIRRAISRSSKPDFRIVEFNVLTNHIHLIIEATSSDARATGMQGFKVRLARAVNRKLKRSGPLFADRYHSRALRTPREVKNALRYVLNNARHHAAERGVKLPPRWVDPHSSAPWFDGWASPLPRVDLPRAPRPTATPTCWLLAVGWRKHGLILLDDIPGQLRELSPPRVRKKAR